MLLSLQFIVRFREFKKEAQSFKNDTGQGANQRICNSREYTIWLVCLLNLTNDFGVKTHGKLKQNCQPREKSKTGIQSCLHTVNLTPISTYII